MARRTMPVSMLSETTKNKYSQADLHQREENERKVQEGFNTSDKLENKMYKSCDRLEKFFFNEIQSAMKATSSYTKVDSITVSTLANIMWVLYQSRQVLKQDGIMLDFKPHPLLKTIQQYTVLQNQMFKELSLSISERTKLSEMTNYGAFDEVDFSELDNLIEELG